MDLDILGSSEHRGIGEGTAKKENHLFIFSGVDLHQHGFDMLLKKDIENCANGCVECKLKFSITKSQAIQHFSGSDICTNNRLSEADPKLTTKNFKTYKKNLKSTEVLIIMGDFNGIHQTC
ncbi:hypothetical protein ElyMa_005953700 [Elysia marginata]|uniref:Endonuclease/exonuclease/phosphatase domain-containing protein n=1 Tax=Elysia marginata TaxID=1093978 RepID=A0AAV4GB84_9GAST|nr:hypothetical protein ElyMa_005953700 [Elysia marginata]